MDASPMRPNFHVHVVRLGFMRILGSALLAGLLTVECQADELWKLVAKSHYIVIGELAPPVQLIEEAQRTQDHKYVSIAVKVAKCLKGSPCQPNATVRYFTRTVPYGPSPDAVIAQRMKPAILFLLQVDDRYSQDMLFFAGYTPDALQAHSRNIEDVVRLEVSRQAEVLKQMASLYDRTGDPVFERVQSLVNQSISRENQAKAFIELEELGVKAAPAMISLMDDRQPLAIRAISLRNKSANAFEGIRHYGPQLVVDAIAAILNQVTEEDFGFIYNGGTERERRRAVDGWRIYLQHLNNNASLKPPGTDKPIPVE